MYILVYSLHCFKQRHYYSSSWLATLTEMFLLDAIYYRLGTNTSTRPYLEIEWSLSLDRSRTLHETMTYLS